MLVATNQTRQRFPPLGRIDAANVRRESALLHSGETMRNFAALLALLACSQAHANTAIWTGRSEMVQTVTYQWVWRCEYNYNGQRFWRLFQNSCPASIQVQ